MARQQLLHLPWAQMPPPFPVTGLYPSLSMYANASPCLEEMTVTEF